MKGSETIGPKSPLDLPSVARGSGTARFITRRQARLSWATAETARAG
jgi:hypothetical protein